MSSQHYIQSKNNLNAQTQNPFSSQQSQLQPSTDCYDYQTAQFIKTHTHIQNNNINQNTLISSSNNNINGNFNGANTFLANSQQSSSNQNKKSVASKKNSISNKEKIEPMTVSINHMIYNNQSLNEESMDKSNISQLASGLQVANQKAEQSLLKKKQEKSRFKEVLRSRNILFLAIMIFIYQADTIYIHTQTIKNIEINLTSKIFLYILIILQTTIAILFILLGCKKQDYCQIILKQKQSYFGISQIILIVAYYESVSIALGVIDIIQNQITNQQENNLKIILFRFFNILILNASYSLLIRARRFKLFIYLSQLIYFPLRFFMISLKDNYIQFLVILTAFVGLYFQLKLVQEHIAAKKQILTSTKYQKLINGANTAQNAKNIISNNSNNINANNNNQNAGSYLQQSNKGSPPEKDEVQDLLNKQSFNNFNNNQSIQGFQVSYPFISYQQPQQGSQLQKQQSIGQNMNSYISYNKIEVQNIVNTNNNQLASYNSLNSSLVNLEKPVALLESNNHSSQVIINNKRSQFGQTQSSQHIQSGIDLNNNLNNNSTPIQNQIINQGIQNIIRSEKMHQMSKISEQDFENDFSKNNYNNSNQIQNFTQNGQSIVEQKSLIEQVIEVDGIVVFDQETQNVVFANQNILVLLETDVNRVLYEVMSLKQLQVSIEDKSNKENLEYSNTFLLKNLLKDNSVNLLNASPAIGPQNNSTKMSNKIGSNPQLNRVIEEENEQDFSPQLIVKGETLKQEGGKVEQANQFNFSENMVEELSKQGTDKKSLSMMASGTQNNQIKNHQQSKSKFPKSKSHVYTKSRSQNYKGNPFYLSPNQELQPDDDEGVSGAKTHKNESTFKKLSCDNTHLNPISNLDLPSYVQNNYDGQSFLQNRQLRESQDFQIPSFISSISHIPRKNTNQGSYTTLERDRTNTLKDIMDDVRSKSGTFLAQQRKSTITQQRKKTLNNKRQLNYSQQPETVINNMVLCKENTSKIYVMKYSIIEHAGKVLHIITIRDLSNEIFEQILDRQSSVLIDELYRYLNFTEISQILGKSLKQIKSLKYQVQMNEYKQFISPLKLNLKLYKYLMSDIFDIRSLQHRSFILNKDYFDLQQELVNAKKMTEKLRNDIVFNFYYDKMIPIQILNDRERISQILMNLLVNCCKLIKNNKIFLKAKLCKDQNQVKIIIQNRELKKSQKELILKSYQNRLNSLGYHFFISNLLAKQVSNQIHKLEIISNKQEYVKFKFFIYLFTHVNQDNSQINLIKPSLSTNPQQGKSNNTTNENKNQSNTQQYINSLSHLDLENEDQNEDDKNEFTQKEENKIDESPPTHLDKCQINITSNIIKDSKNSSKDNNQKSDPSGNLQQSNKKTLQMIQEQQQVFNQDLKSLKSISNEGTEISEQIDRQKIKDFDNFQSNYPMKFISDLQQQI